MSIIAFREVFADAFPQGKQSRVCRVGGSAVIQCANRRFTDGLQFQINYTFSRSTDTGQVSQTFTPNNGNTPLWWKVYKHC